MSEEQTTQFAVNEGEIPLNLDPENDNSADSSTEKTKKETTHSNQGENTDAEKIPFNDDPKVQDYLSRREKKVRDEMNSEYERKLEETRTQIREEMAKSRQETTIAKKKEIPLWFGGDKSQYNVQQLGSLEKQWDEYLQHEDARIAEAEERAFTRLSSAKTTEEKAQAEATNYLQAEMLAIESDKSLNPQNLKFTKELAEELLAVVMDTENNGKYPMIDAQGRWNYRAAFRILAARQKPTGQQTNQQIQQKKKIGGATTSDNKGGEKSTTTTSSKDLRGKSWGDL